MTASRIYHGTEPPVTVVDGYLTLDASASWMTYSRPLLSSLEILEFCVHVKPTTTGVTRAIAGWAGAYASLLITSVDALQMYFRGTATRSIGNAASPTALPALGTNKWVWVWGKVTRVSANVEYWYSYVPDYPVGAEWISLGAPVVGTYPNEALIATNHDTVLIGHRGSTSGMTGTLDYFEEWDNGVLAVKVDLRDADALPASTALVGTAALTPRVTTLPAKQVKDLWVGNKRRYPLGDGHVRHISGTTAVVANTSPSINTGDIDVRWFGVINDWTNGVGQGLFGQFGTFSPQRSWLLAISSTGGAIFYVSTDGSGQPATTQIAVPFTDGQPGGVRATRVKSTGVTTVWFSSDGVSWTAQTPQTTLAAGSDLFATTENMTIGGYNQGLSIPILGKTYYAEARSAIDGPVVFRVGPESLRNIARDEFEWTCETGQRVQTRGGSGIGIYPSVFKEDMLDIHRGGALKWPADPTNSALGAKWGVSQYDDGTKVVA